MCADVPGLWMVETVGKHSTAKALNSCWGMGTSPSPLKVMVQVNTNEDESELATLLSPPLFITPCCVADKLGCLPEELNDLVQYLVDDCSHLELAGIMTVGRINHFPTQGPNPDFTVSL